MPTAVFPDVAVLDIKAELSVAALTGWPLEIVIAASYVVTLKTSFPVS